MFPKTWLFNIISFFTLPPAKKYDQIFVLTKLRELCDITDILFFVNGDSVLVKRAYLLYNVLALASLQYLE